MQRVILIHGWGGSPNKDWFPWAKKNLEENGFEVFVPEMPDTNYPKIVPWVEKIKETVGELKPSDIFVGHSIGCQAIERYLQTLPDNTKLNKVILIAPWIVLTEETFTEMGEDRNVIQEWYDEPINYEKIKNMAEWTAVFSDNDPFVNYEDNYKIYKEKLDAEIILKKNQEHFSSEGGVNEIPFLLNLLK
ncbi:MAG TPA: alpha/beta fold hydrolase [Alphaproteobacteria bacterium]|jgi:predicted alpha/beta hydrolase family esterase|nr:alpha/beta fold hydrolase [Alphaproteobacteria bacterium]